MRLMKSIGFFEILILIVWTFAIAGVEGQGASFGTPEGGPSPEQMIKICENMASQGPGSVNSNNVQEIARDTMNANPVEGAAQIQEGANINYLEPKNLVYECQGTDGALQSLDDQTFLKGLGDVQTEFAGSQAGPINFIGENNQVFGELTNRIGSGNQEFINQFNGGDFNNLRADWLNQAGGTDFTNANNIPAVNSFDQSSGAISLRGTSGGNLNYNVNELNSLGGKISVGENGQFQMLNSEGGSIVDFSGSNVELVNNNGGLLIRGDGNVININQQNIGSLSGIEIQGQGSTLNLGGESYSGFSSAQITSGQNGVVSSFDVPANGELVSVVDSKLSTYAPGANGGHITYSSDSIRFTEGTLIHGNGNLAGGPNVVTATNGEGVLIRGGEAVQTNGFSYQVNDAGQVTNFRGGEFQAQIDGVANGNVQISMEGAGENSVLEWRDPTGGTDARMGFSNRGVSDFGGTKMENILGEGGSITYSHNNFGSGTITEVYSIQGGQLTASVSDGGLIHTGNGFFGAAAETATGEFLGGSSAILPIVLVAGGGAAAFAIAKSGGKDEKKKKGPAKFLGRVIDLFE